MAEDTIFHKIMRGEIPAKIIHQDELCIAIEDINPAAPVHLLVIPRETLPSLREAQGAQAAVLGHLLVVAGDLARRRDVSNSGYRIVINNGANAQQTVHQLHVHVLGGREFTWPPG